MGVVFFFKQKTAYEMRISDWSSDVCSSDLSSAATRVASFDTTRNSTSVRLCLGLSHQSLLASSTVLTSGSRTLSLNGPVQIGRASCRERVCQYVEISVVAVSLKKNNNIESREHIMD